MVQEWKGFLKVRQCYYEWKAIVYELMSMYDLKFKFNLEDKEYFGTNCRVTTEYEGLEQFGRHGLRSPE